LVSASKYARRTRWFGSQAATSAGTRPHANSADSRILIIREWQSGRADAIGPNEQRRSVRLSMSFCDAGFISVAPWRGAAISPRLLKWRASTSCRGSGPGPGGFLRLAVSTTPSTRCCPELVSLPCAGQDSTGCGGPGPAGRRRTAGAVQGVIGRPQNLAGSGNRDITADPSTGDVVTLGPVSPNTPP
jgi:hypothetical protein